MTQCHLQSKIQKKANLVIPGLWPFASRTVLAPSLSCAAVLIDAHRHPCNSILVAGEDIVELLGKSLKVYVQQHP